MHIDIPAAHNTTAIHEGARVKRAPHPKAARAWLAFIRSPEAFPIPEAFRIVARHGFGQVDATAPTPALAPPRDRPDSG